MCAHARLLQRRLSSAAPKSTAQGLFASTPQPADANAPGLRDLRPKSSPSARSGAPRRHSEAGGARRLTPEQVGTGSPAAPARMREGRAITPSWLCEGQCRRAGLGGRLARLGSPLAAAQCASGALGR
jgi:hypothetical protein